MKILILISFISLQALASDHIFWQGEVRGLTKTDREDVWRLKTQGPEEITLDCASYIYNLGVVEGETKGMIALTEQECYSFSKEIPSWTRWGRATEIVIDSYNEPILYRK